MTDKVLHKVFQHPITGRLNRWAPGLCSAAFVVLLAWWAAAAVWAFVPVSSGPELPVENEGSGAAKGPSPVRYGAQVANKHLFGRASVKAEAGEIGEAPETRLDLVLRGVLAIQPTEFALAMISRGSSGTQEVYGIGDSLPGNAELVEVHSDRVILLYQGRYETLRLPDSPQLDIATQAASATSEFLPGQESEEQSIPPDRAKELRSKFLESPSSLMEMVSIKPRQEDGELIGYQVNPKGDPALFYQTGLRDGDVIVSVNSIPVNKPDRINQLRDADQYDVVVLRNGSRQMLSISFN